MKRFIIILLVGVLFEIAPFISTRSLAQTLTSAQKETGLEKKSETFANIIAGLEEAIKNNDPEPIARQFAKRVFLNLHGENNNYFSANQGFYVLKNFLSSYRILNLKFTKQGESGDEYFATGGALLVIKGKREPVQVYVSFVKVDGSYLITQFNIY